MCSFQDATQIRTHRLAALHDGTGRVERVGIAVLLAHRSCLVDLFLLIVSQWPSFTSRTHTTRHQSQPSTGLETHFCMINIQMIRTRAIGAWNSPGISRVQSELLQMLLELLEEGFKCTSSKDI